MDRPPKGLIRNISTLMCSRKYPCSLLCVWGVSCPPGCDIWFPRPGHNGSDSMPPEVEQQRPVKLYNIEKDPEERNEVSAHFPTVVDYLLSRLDHYQKSAVPIIFPDDDPKCDPGPSGAWGPWT